jgi:hypothetical protein
VGGRWAWGLRHQPPPSCQATRAAAAAGGRTCPARPPAPAWAEGLEIHLAAVLVAHSPATVSVAAAAPQTATTSGLSPVELMR